MLLISQPIPCPNCGKNMENYSVDSTSKKVVFKCKCGCIHTVTFDEYRQLLRNKYHIK